MFDQYNEWDVERFWSHVDKNGPIPERRPDLGPCWIWIRGKQIGGYGYFNVQLDSGQWRVRRAHRVAYEIAVGSSRLLSELVLQPLVSDIARARERLVDD